MARIAPLFSGSSGNCIAVGGRERFVLIDIGMSAKRIECALRERQYDITRLAAIFITHEHSDHICGLRVFASRHRVPVYATKGTLFALNQHDDLRGISLLECSLDGVTVGGIRVTPFPTMHDTIESCGYVIETADKRRIAIATDTGIITDDIRAALRGCHLVYIESNHDVDMLTTGSYPYYLKHRVLSTRGHLSNDACAAELPDLAKSGTTRFMLAHISKQNNLPELARKASLDALLANGLREGVDFTLQTVPPEGLPMLRF